MTKQSERKEDGHGVSHGWGLSCCDTPVIRRGSVLVFSLIVLSFILVSALSVATVAVTERRASFSTERSARAYQIAESGIELILHEIYKGNDGADVGVTESIENIVGGIGAECNGEGVIEGVIAGGTFKIKFSKDAADEDDPPVIITDCDELRGAITLVRSEGIYKNTVRAVQYGVRAPQP